MFFCPQPGPHALAGRQGPEPQPKVAHTTQPQTLSVIKPTIREMRGSIDLCLHPAPTLVTTPNHGTEAKGQDSSNSEAWGPQW